MAWLASVGLVAVSGERDRAALAGAWRMLSMGGVAGVLMLIGAGLIYRSAGGVEIAALSSEQIAAPDLCAAGAGLVLAGLALKAGVAPLHLWMGAAYGRSGALATLALGVIGGVGALAALARVASAALAAPAIAQGVSAALVAIGIASVVIGSVQAIGARNVRRLAAYAGAAQAGCVLVSAALGSPAGVAATLVQILAQAAAAMAVLGGEAALGGAPTLASLDGLSRRAPLASAALAAGALSLMGAPLTLGFLGRWRLIEAGVGGGYWWAAGAVIAASLAAVIYGGRLIERLYFRHSSAVTDPARDPWRAALAPALIVAIALIVIGVEPAELLRAADAAARLFSGEPQ
jgi:multicomponent Na+:H+ antiporter subunit D